MSGRERLWLEKERWAEHLKLRESLNVRRSEPNDGKAYERALARLSRRPPSLQDAVSKVEGSPWSYRNSRSRSPGRR